VDAVPSARLICVMWVRDFVAPRELRRTEAGLRLGRPADPATPD